MATPRVAAAGFRAAPAVVVPSRTFFNMFDRRPEQIMTEKEIIEYDLKNYEEHKVPNYDDYAVTNPKLVNPDVYETLEWCLETPPPIHQFEEPPLVVEIAHMFDEAELKRIDEAHEK